MTEQTQVPAAEFRSYYGRPILKVSRWKEPHLPAYLFLGELSGALAMVGAVAHAAGKRPLARTARVVSALAAAGGGAFLTAELGRPERFLNMLRVAKPTSPMSVGSWILASHSGLVSAAAAGEVSDALAGVGTLAGVASALTGPLLAVYPGVLLANTAVPAWHDAQRELPMLFAGGAMTAAGAAGLLASVVSSDRKDFDAAFRLAMIGAAVESSAGYMLETMPGPSGDVYRTGEGGRMISIARYLTVGGGLAALCARRSRLAAAVSGALLTGGGFCAKVAVLRAGKASAADPRYVVAGQRSDSAASTEH
jgi:formate-dependent nitrite reductase membrane component NrfD